MGCIRACGAILTSYSSLPYTGNVSNPWKRSVEPWVTAKLYEASFKGSLKSY